MENTLTIEDILSEINNRILNYRTIDKRKCSYCVKKRIWARQNELTELRRFIKNNYIIK